MSNPEEEQRAHEEWWKSWTQMTRLAERFDRSDSPGPAGQETPLLEEIDELRRLDDAHRAALLRWAEKIVESRRNLVHKQEVQPGQRLTVTVAEAAQMLGIGRGTAYELIRRGKIPSLRLGTKIVVPKTALVRLVDGG